MKNFTILSIFLMLFTVSLLGQSPTPVNFSVVPTPITNGDLPMTGSGQGIWGDYNNDGLLDYFIIAGQGDPAGYIARLYKNNGNNTWTEVTTNVTPLAWSSAMFFDANNDGNLDLVVAGSVDGTTTACVTDLFINSGAPNYELVLDETYPFVGISAEGNDNGTRIIEVVDYNNDGWLDVFLTGNHGATWDVSGNSRVVALYKNNNGTFELQTTPVDGSANFLSMNGGSIHSGDVNNDGYADMIVSGYNDNAQNVTVLYVNNGNETFSAYNQSATLFTGQMQGETFFADINNDGWQDIVEVGRDVKNGWASFANLFINNKDLTFTKIASGTTGLIGGTAVAAVGDVNNDGMTDIVLSGWGPNTTFFYNKGDNTFMAHPIDPDIARARAGSISLVDFTNDGNLDFSIFGYRDGGGGTPTNPTWPHYFLVNNLITGTAANTPPGVPLNPRYIVDGTNLTLQWDSPTDDTTPSSAIKYNVYLQHKTTGQVFTYHPADIANGKLKVGGIRPFIFGNTITLMGVSPDNYNIGIQAVDNSNASSAFVTPVLSNIKEDLLGSVVKISVKDQYLVINNNDVSKIEFTIFDVSGKTITEGVCASNNDASVNLSKGVYIVKISNGVNKTSRKVIVL